MLQTIKGWFHGYMAHPFGKNATVADYAVTAVLALLSLYVVFHVISEIKRAA